MTEFDAYLHSSDKYKEVDKVINQLVERGLMATPTIIINDRFGVRHKTAMKNCPDYWSMNYNTKR